MNAPRLLQAITAHLNGQTPQRITKPDGIEAAVALLLTATGDTVELLLIKRAAHDGDPWSGQMALPGGRRDATDADLLATARREVLEETGIRLSRAELLGELDDLFPRTPTLPPVIVRPFVFLLPRRPAVAPNHEVDLHLWIPLPELKAGAATRVISVRGEPRRVPAYAVRNQVVWGMTWRIINPIIALA